MTVSGVTFEDNQASDGGGAVANYYGHMTIEDSTFTGNYSGDDGGAVWSDGGTLAVTGSSFSGNSTYDYGGAIYVQDTEDVAGNAVTIQSSTFSGNVSGLGVDVVGGGDGGAIYIEHSYGDIQVADTTFAGNTAASDGGGLVFSTNDTGDDTLISGSTFSDNVSRHDAEYGAGGGIWILDRTARRRSSTRPSPAIRRTSAARSEV